MHNRTDNSRKIGIDGATFITNYQCKQCKLQDCRRQAMRTMETSDRFPYRSRNDSKNLRPQDLWSGHSKLQVLDLTKYAASDLLLQELPSSLV